jgi:parallel beta-helix repeat protein
MAALLVLTVFMLVSIGMACVSAVGYRKYSPEISMETYAFENLGSSKNLGDTLANQILPDWNYGTSSYLQITGNAGLKFNTYVCFDLSSIPSGATITMASLNLWSAAVPSPLYIDASQCSSAWNENTVTWNNRPDVIGSVQDVKLVGTTAGYRAWNITAAARLSKSGDNKVSIVLEASVNGTVQAYSKEHGSLVPYLEVIYTPLLVTPPSTPSGRIYINGNGMFNADNGVSDGSGTAVDPYIIEDYAIDASDEDGITVKNTTAYFIVRNCLVENGVDSGNGIYLDNVVNGVVSGCVSTNNNTGIIVHDSSYDNLLNNVCTWSFTSGISFTDSDHLRAGNNVCEYNQEAGVSLNGDEWDVVSGNVCEGNGSFGIYLDFPLHIDVINNSCSNNDVTGIFLVYADYSDVDGNYCSGNGDTGVYLLYTDHSDVVNNSCSNNVNYGVWLNLSDYNVISINTCENNDYGIYLESSSYDNIVGNVCEGSTDVGMYLMSSSYNILNFNYLLNSTANNAMDADGTNYWDNNGYGNYWDDWQTPDADYNGIVDAARSISGGSNVDHYPLVLIEEGAETTATVMTLPVIIENVPAHGGVIAGLQGQVSFNMERSDIDAYFDFSTDGGTTVENIFYAATVHYYAGYDTWGFTYGIVGLSPTTTYSYRAWVRVVDTNATVYGSWLNFVEENVIYIPVDAAIITGGVQLIDNTTVQTSLLFMGITDGYAKTFFQLSFDGLSVGVDYISASTFTFVAGQSYPKSGYMSSLAASTTYYYRAVATIWSGYGFSVENIYGEWKSFTTPNVQGIIVPPSTVGINIGSWADAVGNALFGGVTMANGESSARASGGIFLSMIMMLMVMLPLVYFGMPPLGVIGMMIIMVGFTTVIGWMPGWIALVIGIGFSLILARMFAGI